MKKSKNILATTMVAGALVTQRLGSNGQTAQSFTPPSKEAIRPFKINFPQKKLDDLKRVRYQLTE